MSKKRKKIKTLIIHLFCALFLNLHWECLIFYNIVDLKTWQLHYPKYIYTQIGMINGCTTLSAMEYCIIGKLINITHLLIIFDLFGTNKYANLARTKRLFISIGWYYQMKCIMMFSVKR